MNILACCLIHWRVASFAAPNLSEVGANADQMSDILSVGTMHVWGRIEITVLVTSESIVPCKSSGGIFASQNERHLQFNVQLAFGGQDTNGTFRSHSITWHNLYDKDLLNPHLVTKRTPNKRLVEFRT